MGDRLLTTYTWTKNYLGNMPESGSLPGAHLVDLQKAYDTLDWDFLKETLTFLNFPCRFIDWIMECVSTASYSISLNGHYHGLLLGKGDFDKVILYPHSCLLFSLRSFLGHFTEWLHLLLLLSIRIVSTYA